MKVDRASVLNVRTAAWTWGQGNTVTVQCHEGMWRNEINP